MTAPARAISRKQARLMFVLCNQIGLHDRAARLAELSSYLHRPLATTNDLSADEAKMLIDWLDRRVSEKP